MTITHCHPTGALAFGAVDTPRIGADLIRMDDSTLISGGNVVRRGRVILNPGIGGSTLANPFFEPTNNGGTLPVLTGGPTAQFRARLNALGYQTVQVPNIPQGRPTQWDLVLDPLTDAGFGTRFVQRNMLFFDHLMYWCQANYGGIMPTFVVGMSWGAWSSLQQAINRGGIFGPLGIDGAYAHCPINDFAKTNAAEGLVFPAEQSPAYVGMSLSTTALNSVAIPVRVTWGISDNFITGGNGSYAPPVDAMAMTANGCIANGGTAIQASGTVTGASIGVNMHTDATWIAGHGVLNLTSTAGFPVPSSPLGVPLTQLNTFFGTITETMTYTGVSGNTLTGCTFMGIAGGNAILTSSTVCQYTEADATWGGMGTGSVTGIGMNENHAWDGLPPVDTADCINWFNSVISPVYPAVF